LLALFVAWVIGAAWVRWSGPDARQRAALAVLEAPVAPVAGRNLADAAWLLPHDVPADKRPAVLAALREREARAYALRLEGRTAEAEALPDPRDAYPAFPELPDDQAFCDAWATDCLARVREHPEATRTAVEAHRPALDAMLALADHDGFRIGTAMHTSALVPGFGSHRRLVPTHFAARFALGEHEAALSGLCADLAGWRRIGADSDHLITAMVATSYARQDVRLLAEFVAALAPGEPVPGACAAAIAPGAPEETSVCGPMRGEFEMMRGGMQVARAGDEGDMAGRLFSPERMAALLAPHYAFYCSPAAAAQAAADTALVLPDADKAGCPRWELAFDPVDCILVEIAGGNDLGKYADRRTDLVAELALVRTALWLRDTDADPRPRAQRLRERPATLGLRRDVVLDADGMALTLPLLDRQRDAQLRLPLPPKPV
jgi:hypothetical protein